MEQRGAGRIGRVDDDPSGGRDEDDRPPVALAARRLLELVAMEVFMEQQVVAPMRVGLKHLVRAKHGSAAMGITQKDVCQPAREFLCDLPERPHGA